MDTCFRRYDGKGRAIANRSTTSLWVFLLFGFGGGTDVPSVISPKG